MWIREEFTTFPKGFVIWSVMGMHSVGTIYNCYNVKTQYYFVWSVRGLHSERSDNHQQRVKGALPPGTSCRSGHRLDCQHGVQWRQLHIPEDVTGEEVCPAVQHCWCCGRTLFQVRESMWLLHTWSGERESVWLLHTLSSERELLWLLNTLSGERELVWLLHTLSS